MHRIGEPTCERAWLGNSEQKCFPAEAIVIDITGPKVMVVEGMGVGVSGMMTIHSSSIPGLPAMRDLLKQSQLKPPPLL